MPMAVNWHQLRLGPSDMYRTWQASFKDTLSIGMHQGEPRSCDCTSLDISTQAVFLYYMSVKYTFRVYFWCFLVSMLPTGCNVKKMKSIQFFNPSSVIYIIAQVNSSTIANICWWIQTFKYQCYGFQVHFKSVLVYNLKTKRDFLSKCPHYIMGCIINFGPMFFPIFIGFELGIYRIFNVPNLKCIHAVFAMLWPFQQLLVPRYSTGWSVAKLFLVSVVLIYLCATRPWRLNNTRLVTNLNNTVYYFTKVILANSSVRLSRG